MYECCQQMIEWIRSSKHKTNKNGLSKHHMVEGETFVARVYAILPQRTISSENKVPLRNPVGGI